MKKILVILVILGATAATAVMAECIRNLKNRFADDYSSDKRIERSVSGSDFHAIHASRAVEVLIVNASMQAIHIEAPEKLMPHVIVREQNGILQISIDKKVKRISNAAVKVYVPTNGKIDELQASSAAKIICQTSALGAESFTLDASSAGRIEAAVNTEHCRIEASSASMIKAAIRTGDCTIDISSAAKVVLAGSADKCTADMSSAAKLNAPEFQVARYEIGTSSGAGASIQCTEELRAEASSGSSIEYTGDCTTDLSRSSGGSIHQTR
ncbi:DUF2807 domain-containing protein [Alistipes sp.]|uniref:GIN domain-containing protein n=1 Tax=Alistipes sp. TaxID=1872444 RepID=UPI0025C055FB|nr:DUF2807 domain-containing protein [Alistipes sp.]MCI7139757.1 DUF2807 domain-containing protein [Alistipes sp.]MDY5396667.1 DUF2807 domain-containing protein [Alistipes sp.]